MFDHAETNMSDDHRLSQHLPVPFSRSYWVLPGLLLAGEYPGARKPEEARRRMSGLADLGIRRIINLMEEDERDHSGNPFASYEPIMDQLCRERNMQAAMTRFPVVDLDTPEPDTMITILDTIDASIGRGKAVYVHCWGGIGRTGMVVGCFLIRHGLAHGGNVLDKLARLRADDPKRHRVSPEGPGQREYLRQWQRHERVSPGGLSRYAGCLAGGAVGDALGAPVEFMSTGRIRQKYGNAGITDYDHAYGRIGAVTDDTQMTLFAVEGLLRARAGGGLYERDCVLVQGYNACKRWLRTQREHAGSGRVLGEESFLMAFSELFSQRAPGNSCLSALEAPGMGTVNAPVNNSKGCGGVMRMAPVGLMVKDPEEAFQTGTHLAALTHGHPTGYLSAGFLASMIGNIQNGAGIFDAVQAGIEILKKYPEYGETLVAVEKAVALAQHARPSPEMIERMGGGWVAEEALAISIYCSLAYEGDFSAGVLAAVNHDGDSDSTGAITGNILGCRLGASVIPPTWIDRLELNALILSMAVDMFTGFRDDDAWRARYPG